MITYVRPYTYAEPYIIENLAKHGINQALPNVSCMYVLCDCGDYKSTFI